MTSLHQSPSRLRLLVPAQTRLTMPKTQRLAMHVARETQARSMMIAYERLQASGFSAPRVQPARGQSQPRDRQHVPTGLSAQAAPAPEPVQAHLAGQQQARLRSTAGTGRHYHCMRPMHVLMHIDSIFGQPWLLGMMTCIKYINIYIYIYYFASTTRSSQCGLIYIYIHVRNAYPMQPCSCVPELPDKYERY